MKGLGRLTLGCVETLTTSTGCRALCPQAVTPEELWRLDFILVIQVPSDSVFEAHARVCLLEQQLPKQFKDTR